MSRKRICRCGKTLNYNEDCTCYNRKEYEKQYYEKNKEIQSALTSQRWKRKRKHIINRDGGVCQRCLHKYGIVNSEELQVHHIKPRIKYPELIYEDSNLVTLCKTCNLQIGTSEQLDFEHDIETREFTL